MGIDALEFPCKACLMQNKFTEAMRNRSNVELLEITGNLQHEYVPEAVEAAMTELTSRELTEETLREIEREAAGREAEKENRKILPLENHWKALLILFPGILSLLAASNLRAGGYDRGAREVWRWSLMGLVCYAGTAVAVYFAIWVLGFISG
jgi:predicted DNA-binding protein